MEQHTCLECNATFGYLKTLGRHVRDVHKMQYIEYLTRHGKSQTRTCHCGKTFENTRYPGGPRANGRAQVHCSPQCTQIATNCRARGLDVKTYWEWQRRGCEICGSKLAPEGKTNIAIDHNHETGKVRGLLCHTCNVSKVGSNTVQTARAVLEYLLKYDGEAPSDSQSLPMTCASSSSSAS